MRKKNTLNQIRERRQKRTRAKIMGDAARPRVAVFRSNTSIYAQLINDMKGVTLVAASSKELAKKDQEKSKTEQATLVGKLMAEKAAKAGITRAVLDRRSYSYHGRVKALTEAARQAGLHI